MDALAPCPYCEEGRVFDPLTGGMEICRACGGADVIAPELAHIVLTPAQVGALILAEDHLETGVFAAEWAAQEGAAA